MVESARKKYMHAKHTHAGTKAKHMGADGLGGTSVVHSVTAANAPQHGNRNAPNAITMRKVNSEVNSGSIRVNSGQFGINSKLHREVRFTKIVAKIRHGRR